MTSAQQNPSLTRNPGSASRRSNGASLQTSAGNLHSTAGEGAPGSRLAKAGAGGKLLNTVSSLRRVNPVRGGTGPAF